MSGHSIATVRRVAKLWNSKDKPSSRVIAERLGLNRNSILSMATRYRDMFERRKPVKGEYVAQPAPDADLLAEAARLWNAPDKRPAKAIALGLGISTSTLSVWIGRYPDLFERRVPRKGDVLVPDTVRRAEDRMPQRLKEKPAVVAVEADLAALFAAPQTRGGSGEPVTLMQLTSRSCRWPHAGQGAATLFCGGHTATGSSYCPHHQAKSKGGAA